MSKKPHVLILGGNFAGLQVARHLREYVKDNAEITVVDRKSYLLYVPNWAPHDFMKGLPISDEVGDLYDPAVVCYGDMGDNKAFYIHSNIWYGGSKSTLKMGHLYYMIKVALKNMYFSRGGKIKSWELDFGEILSDHL